MLSLWFKTALLCEGWANHVRVTVDAGLISAITPDVASSAADERYSVAVPGLCNVHSHAFQRGMAGLTEFRGPGADDFWTWRELMYRFLDRIEPEDVEAITAQAYVEMLQTGFTRVGEFHYLHHDQKGAPYANLAETADRVASAADDTGIGLTLLPVFYAHGDFGGAPPSPGQRRFLNDIDRFAAIVEASRRAVARLPDANLGVAPHSLRAVTPAELALMGDLHPSGPIHIHAAEQAREVEGCLSWSGQRPVQWLLEHAEVDSAWCLIHATHLCAAETLGLAASGAVAGLCPITEANLGDGVFPADAFVVQGGQFAIGSDSNVLIDPAQELRLLEYAQRLTRQARNVLSSTERPSTGASLFDGALKGGAQALGQAVTGLDVGASADIVELDGEHASLYGRAGDALLDAWVFAATPGVLRNVWRRGERVVSDGRHRHLDRVSERYRRTMDKLLRI